MRVLDGARTLSFNDILVLKVACSDGTSPASYQQTVISPQPQQFQQLQQFQQPIQTLGYF